MIAIAGATGNTGRVVAKSLLRQGKKVRVIGRSAERLQPLAAQGAEPFVCNVSDPAKLTEAFAGASAVYAMIPPDMADPDPRAYQDRVTDSLAAAIEKAGVKYVVSLSSVGADKADKVGPVVGLHTMEGKLNRIAGLNVLHLRPGYFMENTLAQLKIIQMLGGTAGPLRPDLKVAMIATRDIGEVAAKELAQPGFTGHSTRELLGQRDITMTEVAAIIGKAIGNPGLAYMQLPDAQIKFGMTQMGMSERMVDLLLEMSAAMNSSYMGPLEKRSAVNTTPTSYETFVAEVFVPLYQGKAAGA